MGLSTRKVIEKIRKSLPKILKDFLADAVQKTQGMAGADDEYEAHRKLWATPELLLRFPQARQRTRTVKNV